MSAPANNTVLAAAIKIPTERHYLAIATDPVHVGTGDYNLGRVDNTIVREPGTDLPYIPGTTLAGNARANSAMTYGDGRNYKKCAGKEDIERNPERCGDPGCHICLTYGHTFASGSSAQGLAAFHDAKIVFFPVYSMSGPVWVTCRDILKKVFDINVETDYEKIKLTDMNLATAYTDAEGAEKKALNLGWLFLEADIDRLTLDLTTGLADYGLDASDTALVEQMRNRLVVVSDDLFAHVVNSNLELRTSVAISPETGAAEDGALFTYEAIPRATVFAFSVTIADPNLYVKARKAEMSFNDVQTRVDDGLRLFQHLGVGGMNTRGFGRIRVCGIGG